MDSENTKHVKSGKKFGFYFAITTSLLIAAAVIFTTLLLSNCISSLINDFKETTDSYDSFMLTTIAKTVTTDMQEGKTFNETSKFVSLMKQNNYAGYAYVYNLKDNKVIWASDNSYLDQNESELKEYVLPYVDLNNNIKRNEMILGTVGVAVGMIQNKAQGRGYQNMFDNLKFFVILFLLIGVIASAFMSKMINKPLVDLVSGVQEFGKGNFGYKLKDTGFEEIDQLVNAYNHMASQLFTLYESLETKVEERTKELEKANQKLKETQTMMVHSEKMRSLGELVAGIAHEINNPINFIYGNIMILDNYQKDLITLIDKYDNVNNEINETALKDINDFKQKIDMDFLKEDIGDLIKSCMEGVERTKNIILDLKNFSRMDEMVFSECNIPKEIDTTLNILNNKIKNRITVHKNYEENLPKIEAYGGQINQVFMNILDNAQSAINGVGDIYITAKKDGDNVSVQFEDTGCGIKQEDLVKIFEPFYTTKPVGQGTGLGMSIAYRVIEAHKGKISVESELGHGTKITIVLPIEHKEAQNEGKESLNG